MGRQRKENTACFPVVVGVVGKTTVDRNLNEQQKKRVTLCVGQSQHVPCRLGAPVGGRAPGGGFGACAALPWEPTLLSGLTWGCVRAAGRGDPCGEGTVLTVTAQREGRAAAAEGAVFGGRLGRPLTGGQREGGRGVEQHQADSHNIP